MIESRIDSCPLPINEMIQLDELICHETGSIINGLWLRILLFLFSILIALCIFPIYISKRFI